MAWLAADRRGALSRGFESFRTCTNYEYLKDAPLKIAVPTAIGTVLASIGGLAGRIGQETSAPI